MSFVVLVFVSVFLWFVVCRIVVLLLCFLSVVISSVVCVVLLSVVMCWVNVVFSLEVSGVLLGSVMWFDSWLVVSVCGSLSSVSGLFVVWVSS